MPQLQPQPRLIMTPASTQTPSPVQPPDGNETFRENRRLDRHGAESKEGPGRRFRVIDGLSSNAACAANGDAGSGAIGGGAYGGGACGGGACGGGGRRAWRKLSTTVKAKGAFETAEYRKALYARMLTGKPRTNSTETWIASFSSLEDWTPPQMWYVLTAVVTLELWAVWLVTGGEDEKLPSLDPGSHAIMMGLLAFLYPRSSPQTSRRRSLTLCSLLLACVLQLPALTSSLFEPSHYVGRVGFRTNQAYDRWWEGRRLWGEIVFSSRNLASNAASAFTDMRRVRRLVVHLMVFAWARASGTRSRPRAERCCC